MPSAIFGSSWCLIHKAARFGRALLLQIVILALVAVRMCLPRDGKSGCRAIGAERPAIFMTRALGSAETAYYIECIGLGLMIAVVSSTRLPGHQASFCSRTHTSRNEFATQPCAAANPAKASRLQSLHPVRRVAELLSLGPPCAYLA